MEHIIRAVRADEWEKAREIRLAALQDPAAPIAFMETYEQGLAHTPDFWRERTRNAAAGVAGNQFIAEGPGGRWVGTVTALVERPAAAVGFGEAARVDQTHLVGVFVRPEARGIGVTEELFRAAVDWSWSLPGSRIERVRLYVHEDNARAAAFYRRFGFVPSGESVPGPPRTSARPSDPPARELEYELWREISR
ncbi:GNAT family N-acetyltransferase [Streptomyces sp. NPDC059881]|uniref:GNAT family N-acetyltransferase n=1 Tax=Streptomyces sp. NPDC059881 TaxID=3346986 RepID=UPI00365D20F1